MREVTLKVQFRVPQATELPISSPSVVSKLKRATYAVPMVLPSCMMAVVDVYKRQV